MEQLPIKVCFENDSLLTLDYSGISLVRRARDLDFLYGLNIVRTKKFDCVRIFPLPYVDPFDRINVACLTVLSIWGLVPWIIFKFIWRQITNHSAAGILFKESNKR